MLVGIALYNAASAKMVSRASNTLFIRGVSLRTLLRVAKYMPISCFVSSGDLWIIVVS